LSSQALKIANDSKFVGAQEVIANIEFTKYATYEVQSQLGCSLRTPK